MTKSRKAIHQLNTDVVGYWEGEALERGRRYSYRFEFLPLLLDYLGARAKMRILDVGCGTGFLARLMAQNLQNVQVVGLEGDGKLLSLGQEKLVMETLEDRVSFRQGDAYQLPFKDDAFDLVTSHTLL
jgi:ubiquinone/menaquinone biosynthesis C-methylase UbiE